MVGEGAVPDELLDIMSLDLDVVTNEEVEATVLVEERIAAEVVMLKVLPIDAVIVLEKVKVVDSTDTVGELLKVVPVDSVVVVARELDPNVPENSVNVVNERLLDDEVVGSDEIIPTGLLDLASIGGELEAVMLLDMDVVV